MCPAVQPCRLRRGSYHAGLPASGTTPSPPRTCSQAGCAMVVVLARRHPGKEPDPPLAPSAATALMPRASTALRTVHPPRRDCGVPLFDRPIEPPPVLRARSCCPARPGPRRPSLGRWMATATTRHATGRTPYPATAAAHGPLLGYPDHAAWPGQPRSDRATRSGVPMMPGFCGRSSQRSNASRAASRTRGPIRRRAPASS